MLQFSKRDASLAVTEKEAIMPLDPARLLAHPFADRVARFRPEDAILYAVCCGAQQDLRLVHEDGLSVLPSFGQNLCFDDSWMEQTGVDLSRVVHGGLDLRIHGPLEPDAELLVRPSIAGLVDKGEGRPAMIVLRTDVFSGERPVFTSMSNLFVIKGGGFGGSVGEAFEMIRTPEGEADTVALLPTRVDSPVLFRLLGDRNPLHVLPEVAAAAGFERPIMHGANTFGLACAEILRTHCDGDPARLGRIAARFSGPLYPGETLRLDSWARDGKVFFAARAQERDAPVLDGGLAEVN